MMARLQRSLSKVEITLYLMITIRDRMFAKMPRGLSVCGTRQNVQFVKHVFFINQNHPCEKKSIFLKGRQQKYHFHSLILCLCSGFAEATSAPTIKLDGKGDQEKRNVSQLPDFLFLSCPAPLVDVTKCHV